MAVGIYGDGKDEDSLPRGAPIDTRNPFSVWETAAREAVNVTGKTRRNEKRFMEISQIVVVFGDSEPFENSEGTARKCLRIWATVCCASGERDSLSVCWPGAKQGIHGTFLLALWCHWLPSLAGGITCRPALLHLCSP
ncbi:hypothetical protein E2C01_078640 [Portunus trituberculatus]|uniref:Uncharacterized protein n=1 Tax=Portunus trituberculatus TaxID=210409 RepID=A0A5B7ITA4_PORTR|nr:hypothetical protein [Portunus trituberculatus]